MAAVKSPPAIAGDTGPVSGSRRSPGGGKDNPLQHSCLGNPMDREDRQATVHGVEKESDTTRQLKNSSNNIYTL